MPQWTESQICGISASMNANESTTEYSRWGLALDEIDQLDLRLVLATPLVIQKYWLPATRPPGSDLDWISIS